MKLRYEIDQAEAFRRGVDVPKSIVTIEIDPAKLDQEDRDLIADRMHGIDVCQIVVDKGETTLGGEWEDDNVRQETLWKPKRIKAVLPTREAFMDALRQDKAQVEKALAEQKGEAQPKAKLAAH